MRLDKKPNDRVAVALVLCFCVVAIASIFSMRSNLEQLDLDSDDNINISQQRDENKGQQNEQNVVNPVPTVDSTTPNLNTADDKEKNNTGSPAFVVPVNGTITKGFSSEVPVYSKTLDQYAIHTGIDIEAPADTQVLAVADGTVTKVYNDDKLGLSIEISHGNGLVSKYSNLSTTKMVGEGDVVRKGDVISGVGNSALFESLESPHLHFEVLKDGVPTDPSTYVKR